MPYEQSSGMGIGKILIIALLLIAIGIFAMLYFGIWNKSLILSWFHLEQTPQSIIENTAKSNSLSTTVETPNCLRQNIQVSPAEDKPVSISILGADSTLGCCVTAYTGFTCGSEKQINIYQCKTSQIAGEIIYSRQENQFIDNSIAIGLISQLRKTSVC